MGVPSFYRWLVNKYPKVVSDAEGGDHVLEFDNFYLDMNGIIHPCFRPEDNLFPPTTFEEVFNKMYEYIDHLFDLAKPKKLLFMAIDGVAPRAKMNQQRSRRFRAAKDTEMAEEMEEKLRKQFEIEGKAVFPKEESEVSDSNVITPGTEFMNILSEKLKCYVNDRMRENPAWGNIKVILSDDKVPGEGEHKIMSFIRAQRLLPGYDPNTRHCLYGLDADLIMLALATHECHFCILREEVLNPNRQPHYEASSGNSCRTMETQSLKSRGFFKEKASCVLDIKTQTSALQMEAKWPVKRKQPHQFLDVCVLREYLALDLEVASLEEKTEFDLERAIDDFIFICFFAGNDFLPHMPTLEIHEGCVDLLMHVYKKEFQNFGGYLVDMQKVDDKKGAYVKLKRVEKFILAVGAYEEQIFAKRSQLKERKLRRILTDYMEAKEHELNQLDEGTSSDIVGMHAIAGVAGLQISTLAVDEDEILNNTKELKQKVKEYIRSQSDSFKDGCPGTDKVKLGSPGWKERYYKEKFSAESPEEMEATRKSVVAKYGEGLCWVLLYYFSGVPSWTWFYPYHYGPLASDLRGLSQTKTKFLKGSPFKPFDQLMGVLPPRSSHALPLPYKGLMIDDNSSIISFYPTDFETDVDGKRFLWQGICKLPFIEEERLLTETRKLEKGLKDDEKTRNALSLDRLFVRWSRKTSLCSGARATSEKIKGALIVQCPIEGIRGIMHVMPEDLNEVVDDKTDDFSGNDLCVFFEIPSVSQHIPRLLEGVNIPEKTVSREDIQETVLWHEHNGNTTSRNINLFQNQRNNTKPNFDFRPQNPPAFVHNGTGAGFIAGRGKTSSSPIMPRQNSISASYQACGTSVHESSSVARPTYRGSFTRGGYGGGEARWNSESSRYYTSYNRPCDQAGGSSWRPYGGRAAAQDCYQAGGSSWRPYGGRGAAQDWRTINHPVAAQRGGQPLTYVQNYGPRYYPDRQFSANLSRQETYVQTSGPIQNSDRQFPANLGRQETYAQRSGTTHYSDRPVSANAGRPDTYVQSTGPKHYSDQPLTANSGRGRGRGRGWYAA